MALLKLHSDPNSKRLLCPHDAVRHAQLHFFARHSSSSGMHSQALQLMYASLEGKHML